MINSLETVKIEIPQPQPEARGVVLPDVEMPAMPPENVNTWLVANQIERKERRAFRAVMIFVWLFIIACWIASLYITIRWRI